MDNQNTFSNSFVLPPEEQFIQINNVTPNLRHAYVNIDGCLLKLSIPKEITTKEDLVLFIRSTAEELRAKWLLLSQNTPIDVNDILGELP